MSKSIKEHETPKKFERLNVSSHQAPTFDLYATENVLLLEISHNEKSFKLVSSVSFL